MEAAPSLRLLKSAPYYMNVSEAPYLHKGVRVIVLPTEHAQFEDRYGCSKEVAAQRYQLGTVLGDHVQYKPVSVRIDGEAKPRDIRESDLKPAASTIRAITKVYIFPEFGRLLVSLIDPTLTRYLAVLNLTNLRRNNQPVEFEFPAVPLDPPVTNRAALDHYGHDLDYRLISRKLALGTTRWRDGHHLVRLVDLEKSTVQDINFESLCVALPQRQQVEAADKKTDGKNGVTLSEKRNASVRYVCHAPPSDPKQRIFLIGTNSFAIEWWALDTVPLLVHQQELDETKCHWRYITEAPPLECLGDHALLFTHHLTQLSRVHLLTGARQEVQMPRLPPSIVQPCDEVEGDYYLYREHKTREVLLFRSFSDKIWSTLQTGLTNIPMWRLQVTSSNNTPSFIEYYENETRRVFSQVEKRVQSDDGVWSLVHPVLFAEDIVGARVARLQQLLEAWQPRLAVEFEVVHRSPLQFIVQTKTSDSKRAPVVIGGVELCPAWLRELQNHLKNDNDDPKFEWIQYPLFNEFLELDGQVVRMCSLRLYSISTTMTKEEAIQLLIETKVEDWLTRPVFLAGVLGHVTALAGRYFTNRLLVETCYGPERETHDKAKKDESGHKWTQVDGFYVRLGGKEKDDGKTSSSANGLLQFNAVPDSLISCAKAEDVQGLGRWTYTTAYNSRGSHLGTDIALERTYERKMSFWNDKERQKCTEMLDAYGRIYSSVPVTIVPHWIPATPNTDKVFSIPPGIVLIAHKERFASDRVAQDYIMRRRLPSLSGRFELERTGAYCVRGTKRRPDWLSLQRSSSGTSSRFVHNLARILDIVQDEDKEDIDICVSVDASVSSTSVCVSSLDLRVFVVWDVHYLQVLAVVP